MKRGVQFVEAEAKEMSALEAGDTVVHTTKGDITARHIYISTYDPFNRPKELLFHKGTYISYVMEIDIPKGALPKGIYEDMDNPYYYFRIDEGKTTIE